MNEEAAKVGQVIDHLVGALGSDPSAPLRRALVLTDIDEHPGTTQGQILERLQINKSALSRDIEWLYDYGCIIREQSFKDGREIRLHICGYSKKNLDLALENFKFSHFGLKNFLKSFIEMFGAHKPTLRDAKIIALVGEHEKVKKQDILRNLYQGANTTEHRAVNNLMELELLEETENG